VEQIAPALDKAVTRSLRRSTNSAVVAWPLACGSAVAERTQAVSFVCGVLRIEVPDAGWRAELQHLAPRYLAALNRYAAESVERIEFIVRSKGTSQK